jgi:hypothetical protein
MLGTLRAWWKYPPLLDDPFDMQLPPLLGCTADEIAIASVPIAERLLRSDGPLLAGMASPLVTAITTFRPLARIMGSNEFSDALRLVMRSSPAIPAALSSAHDQWKRWLSGVRVFCVSATKDDVHMWSLYGQSHQGAVLELRALQNDRGALREAFPIRYSDEMPVMGSAKQWAEHVFGIQPIDFASFFRALMSTKSRDWEYQQEWRCLVPDADPHLDVPDMPGVWACPILPEEVTSVYLGCKMAGTDRSAILDLVRSRLSHVQVYETIRLADRFALEFHRIA